MTFYPPKNISLFREEKSSDHLNVSAVGTGPGPDWPSGLLERFVVGCQVPGSWCCTKQLYKLTILP